MSKNSWNIWTRNDPLKTGFIKLAAAGREKYGTVIKSGFMRKTVTVKVDNLVENPHYRIFISRPKRFQVHDEEEMCRVGDKVIIRTCQAISTLKHYYIRNFIWMVPRQNFAVNKFLKYEQRALLYNERLRHSIQIEDFKENEKI